LSNLRLSKRYARALFSLGQEDGAFENVYVVHQKKRDGAHDEDKCMIGFASKDEAKNAYEKHGPEWGYGSLTEYTSART